ncbi:MAG: hypothetical protein V7647_3179, partial [Acidobacteriota bacterium]
GHSIHAMLIAFPVGLFVTAVIFDVIYLATKNGQWAMVSYYVIAAGIIGGLTAAVFGLIDYLAIPTGTRAKGVGRTLGVAVDDGAHLDAPSSLSGRSASPITSSPRRAESTRP